VPEYNLPSARGSTRQRFHLGGRPLLPVFNLPAGPQAANSIFIWFFLVTKSLDHFAAEVKSYTPRSIKRKQRENMLQEGAFAAGFKNRDEPHLPTDAGDRRGGADPAARDTNPDLFFVDRTSIDLLGSFGTFQFIAKPPLLSATQQQEDCNCP
jgi:hypothetical protein